MCGRNLEVKLENTADRNLAVCYMTVESHSPIS